MRQQVKRKFPRVAHRRVGEIDIKERHSSGASRRVSIPVTIQQVAPEGIGLSITGRAAALDVGRSITLRFSVAGQAVSLPGRVAWYAPDRNAACDAGVDLQLHLAPAAHRQVYAQWVVSLLRGRA